MSSILVEGRASGGPVLNSNGFVIGVNSSGTEVLGDQPYSFASSVKGLGEVEIGGVSVKQI